jgi:hypothetical protein
MSSDLGKTMQKLLLTMLRCGLKPTAMFTKPPKGDYIYQMRIKQTGAIFIAPVFYK